MLHRTPGTMTSRYRVLQTFAHETPDRVPVNYFANPSINTRLAAHLGVVDTRAAVGDALGADFKELMPRYIGKPLFDDIPNRRVNPLLGSVTRWAQNESGGYWDFCDFPLANADEETIASWPVPSPDDFDYDTLRDACHHYKDKAVCLGHQGVSDVMNTLGMLRGMENIYMDLALENEGTLALMQRRMQSELGVFERALAKCSADISLVWTGEDLGTQHTPLISLAMFRAQIRPMHQPLIDLAKSYAIPVMIHSCGSSSWAFEDFIDMGIAAVDTLQPEASNMNPCYLANTYGTRLAFHGAISTARLASFSADEVRKDVRETCEVLMPYRGFCLAPTHYIQDNTPVENIVAMYQAAQEFGTYPKLTL